MEAPKPYLSPIILNPEEENNLIDFKLIKNDIILKCFLKIINKQRIKFVCSNEIDNLIFKYENSLNMSDFIDIHKYFRMFDSLKELGDEITSLINNKKMEIESVSDNKIILKLDIMTRNNNIVKFILKKVEISEKDKINYSYEEMINLKKDSKIKDKKINDLEKKIEILEKQNSEFKKELNELKKNFEKMKVNETPSNQISNLNNYNSKIFKNELETTFILSNIKNNPKSLELLFSSEIEGENVEKFKSCYTNKNDILVLVKTKKNKRFGGYSHEKFLLDYFNKKDTSAFLFNLDKKKIYQSKGSKYSIWRTSSSPDSMNFGDGADLKIFNKFLSQDGYTTQLDYEYKGEEFALNGEQYFKISVLELYQIKY